MRDRSLISTFLFISFTSLQWRENYLARVRTGRTVLRGSRTIPLSIITRQKINNNMRNNTYSRNGLTLIELVVVLTILVALGGIAAATLPSMLNRTHVATVASSLPTIDASIRQNILLNSGQMGDRFDSLVQADGAVASYVNASGAYEAYTLAQQDVDALADIGITALVTATPAPTDGTPFNATFDGHNGAAVAVSDSTSVCALTDGAATTASILLNVWNIDTPAAGSRYLVMGLGQRSSLSWSERRCIFRGSTTARGRRAQRTCGQRLCTRNAGC